MDDQKKCCLTGSVFVAGTKPRHFIMLNGDENDLPLSSAAYTKLIEEAEAPVDEDDEVFIRPSTSPEVEKRVSARFIRMNRRSFPDGTIAMSVVAEHNRQCQEALRLESMKLVEVRLRTGSIPTCDDY